jgi:hypothetical protein
MCDGKEADTNINFLRQSTLLFDRQGSQYFEKRTDLINEVEKVV